jgi:DNA-binding response OmpR family regulator
MTGQQILFTDRYRLARSPSVRPERSAGARTTYRILVVDDDQAWSETVAELLGREGFEVETAKDGIQGLDLLRQRAGQSDLAILDVHMPRLDGLGVLREWRRDHGPSMPILMMTSADESGIMAQALAEGATSFLRKPISAELLVQAVRRLVDRDGSRDGPGGRNHEPRLLHRTGSA